MKTNKGVNSSFDSFMSFFILCMVTGKRHRRKNKASEVAVASLGVSDREKKIPANPSE